LKSQDELAIAERCTQLRQAIYNAKERVSQLEAELRMLNRPAYVDADTILREMKQREDSRRRIVVVKKRETMDDGDWNVPVSFTELQP